MILAGIFLLAGVMAGNANGATVTLVGDFSYMTVGTVRPVRIQVQNSIYRNSSDVFYVSATSNGELTNGMGFSFYLSSQPFENEFVARVNYDALGNGSSEIFYMKALTAVTPVSVNAKVPGVYSVSVAIGAPPTSGGGGGTNPPPGVSAIGVEDVVPYWLVTPTPVEEPFRNQTVRFTITPNAWLGVSTSQSSTSWNYSIGVDMVIDAAGNGRTSTFYLKGQKLNAGTSIHASTDNHFIAAAQDISMVVVQVTALNWAAVDGDHPLDTNPGIAGGVRHFADKSTTTETNENDWRRVAIKAQISPAIPGMVVRLKVFDVDDPSGNSAVDPNGIDGNDNRGSASTLAASLATDSTGLATLFYTVSTRPGDNYRVAATVSSKPLATTDPLRQKFETITTGPGTTQSPASYASTRLTELGRSYLITESGQAQGTEEPFLSTKLLTIWRRLHIEKDSMGVVTTNHIEGSFLRTQYSPTENYTLFELDQPAHALDVNRFENGRLEFKENATSTPIDMVVIGNTAYGVKVKGKVTGLNFYSDSFKLFDDDDFNNHGGLLNGDEGEEIPDVQTTMLQDSDDASLNVLAAAYIRPKYNLTINDSNLPFLANFNDDERYFDQSQYEDDPDRWTIYLINAYQAAISEDGDPNSEFSGVGRLLPGDASHGSFHGAAIFEEGFRDSESTYAASGQPVPAHATRSRLAAFLVGLLLGADGNDGNLMTAFAPNCTNKCFDLNGTSLAKIRSQIHP